jgi:general L-amino acid transport system substrate-binding protein
MLRSKRFVLAIACVLLTTLASADAQPSTDRLAEIRARGTLNCGVLPTVPGFAIKREETYAGFDIDTCRAVAAAIFGDASKVSFVTLAHIEQFNQRQDIDLVARRLTWTPRRESASGIVFGPVTFYDGQGFLVPRSGQIRRSAQLVGSRVCVINMESHPQTLMNYFKDAGQDVELVLVEDDAQAEAALRSRRCVAYSADLSWLAAARASVPDGVMKYEFLPELISKEPLAPMLRAQDAELLQLVRWTIFSLIEAEELGITARNIDGVKSTSIRARRLLGIHPGSKVALGPGDWVPAIIRSVGNYGEMFDRNLGEGSPIKLERRLNRLWNDGGLMYAPPLSR